MLGIRQEENILLTFAKPLGGIQYCQPWDPSRMVIEGSASSSPEDKVLLNAMAIGL